jgi:hypothetical protein
MQNPVGIEYVQENVTAAVGDGLIALVKSQPEDPIDFLGNFFLHYAKSLESSKAVRCPCVCASLAASALKKWRSMTAGALLFPCLCTFSGPLF